MPYLLQVEDVQARSTPIEFFPALLEPENFHKRQVRQKGLVGLAAYPPLEDLPTQLRMERKPPGGYRKIIGWSRGPFCVAEVIRDLLEDLEPGVHQFHPIELTNKDGSEVIDTYYLLRPPPQIDAVIVEKTIFGTGERAVVQGTLDTRQDHFCSLRKDEIEGRHLWRGVAPMGGLCFGSDVLADTLIYNKWHGWHFRFQCDVE